jgi:hypothetical protein
MAMNVIDIQSRDIYVLFELSLEQIEFILDYLDHCTMEFDSKGEPEMVKAKEYMDEGFFKPLSKLAEELKDGSGPNRTGS